MNQSALRCRTPAPASCCRSGTIAHALQSVPLGAGVKAGAAGPNTAIASGPTPALPPAIASGPTPALPPDPQAARVRCTLGEISDALESAWGRHQATSSLVIWPGFSLAAAPEWLAGRGTLGSQQGACSSRRAASSAATEQRPLLPPSHALAMPAPCRAGARMPASGAVRRTLTWRQSHGRWGSLRSSQVCVGIHQAPVRDVGHGVHARATMKVVWQQASPSHSHVGPRRAAGPLRAGSSAAGEADPAVQRHHAKEGGAGAAGLSRGRLPGAGCAGC